MDKFMQPDDFKKLAAEIPSELPILPLRNCDFYYDRQSARNHSTPVSWGG